MAWKYVFNHPFLYQDDDKWWQWSGGHYENANKLLEQEHLKFWICMKYGKDICVDFQRHSEIQNTLPIEYKWGVLYRWILGALAYKILQPFETLTSSKLKNHSLIRICPRRIHTYAIDQHVRGKFTSRYDFFYQMYTI